MTTLNLKLGWLYPTLMSTYGDRGNVITLEQRSKWRNIQIEIIPLDQDSDPHLFKSIDLLVGGGAQDRQQEIVMRDLKGAKADAIKQLIESDRPGVFTCGSPQLLGHYYEPAIGQRIEGLGILDLHTKHPGLKTPRCIGNLVIEISATKLKNTLGPLLVIGFENHGGRTYLGKIEALGKVISGYGNNGEDQTEGAFYHNAIATYSHGPLLPKNPILADWLIQTALRIKYQEIIPLTPIDDTLAHQARDAMLKRLKIPL